MSGYKYMPVLKYFKHYLTFTVYKFKLCVLNRNIRNFSSLIFSYADFLPGSKKVILFIF